MNKVQDQMPELGPEQQAWLDRNSLEQQQRHARIAADMEALSGQRDEWIKQFLERIQLLGFNYNCDAKRKIPDSELPSQPDRPFKVVF